MPLDFSSAANLFAGTEQELARALGMSAGDLRALRTNPARASRKQLAQLSRILIERGNAMRRVGEMLAEDNPE